MKNNYSFSRDLVLFSTPLPGIKTICQGDQVLVSLEIGLLPSYARIDLIQQTLWTMKTVPSLERRQQLAKALSVYLKIDKEPNNLDSYRRIGGTLGAVAGSLGGIYVMLIGFSALPIGLSMALITTMIIGSVLGMGLFFAVGAILGLVLTIGIIHCIHRRHLRQSEKQLSALVVDVCLSLKEKPKVTVEAAKVVSDAVLSPHLRGSSLSFFSPATEDAGIAPSSYESLDNCYASFSLK